MTEHRYPCPADPGELVAGLVGIDDHTHACIHDILVRPHECSCGFTWTPRPQSVQEVFVEYLIWDREQSIRENRANKRLAIGMVAMFTLVGLICVGALGWQALH